LGIVVVGRDIGTVVLPDAPVKVFLEASLHIRVRRRYDEFRRKDDKRDMGQLTAEIQMRDKIDSERSDSPLRPARDAVIMDTDDLGIEHVADKIVDLVERG
jgi:cytidylate kinase